MSKKITKDEFTTFISKAVGKEVEEFTAKGGSGAASMAITLMGLSIGAKIAEQIFDGENEIEIITDKE